MEVATNLEWTQAEIRFYRGEFFTTCPCVLPWPAGCFSFSHDLPRDAVRHDPDVHARVRGSKGRGDDARPRLGVGAAAARHNNNARPVHFLLLKSEEKAM